MIDHLDQLLQLPDGHRPLHVVVPLANDPEVIRCIGDAMQRKLARFILIGEEDKISQLALQTGVQLASAEFVHCVGEVDACHMAVQMIRDGRAQIPMKGMVNTAVFSRAFLDKEMGLIPNGQIVSHVALFETPAFHKLFIVTDAALHIEPRLDAKACIIRNAVEFARQLGIQRPKVACVSANEKVHPRMQSTLDADALRTMGQRGEFGDALVDGPFGLDVAVSREAADIKGVISEVAGDPDILLLPNLDAANVLYKSLTKLGGGRVASVIVGARAPIVLASRSDSEEVKLLSLALAVKICAHRP